VPTVLAGLSSAVFYALHDMLAQGLTRTAGLVRVLCWIIPTGVVIVVPAALLADGFPDTSGQWRAVAYCAAAGVFYLATWFTILRALQVGDLSLVAPLTALEGLFVAVVAVLRGETLSGVLAVGVALAVVGGTLAAVQGRARSAAGAGWALLTALSFTLVVLCFDQAGELSWISQAAWSRVTTLAFFVPVAAAVLHRSARAASQQGPRRYRALGSRGAAVCVVAGLLELAGLAAMTLAIQKGPLAVAGVTVAQYATVAVVLGLVFLKERPRRHQLVGVVCTLVAVTLLSTGG